MSDRFKDYLNLNNVPLYPKAKRSKYAVFCLCYRRSIAVQGCGLYGAPSGKGELGGSSTGCFSKEWVMLSVHYFFSYVEHRQYAVTDILRKQLRDKIIQNS